MPSLTRFTTTLEVQEQMENVGTVFVVDDDVAVLESMGALIESLGYEVRCFESADQFLMGWAESSLPRCIILDVKMPGMDGLELQKHLVSSGVKVPVIIVSGHADIPKCVSAMKHGAIDFLEKPYRTDHLKDCINSAIQKDQTRLELLKAELAISQKFGLLTNQEKAVLDLMVNGTPNKQIASELDISLRTVQFRRSNIMKKLEVSTRAELVRLVSTYSKSAEKI